VTISISGAAISVPEVAVLKGLSDLGLASGEYASLADYAGWVLGAVYKVIDA